MHCAKFGWNHQSSTGEGGFLNVKVFQHYLPLEKVWLFIFFSTKHLYIVLFRLAQWFWKRCDSEDRQKVTWAFSSDDPNLTTDNVSWHYLGDHFLWIQKKFLYNVSQVSGIFTSCICDGTLQLLEIQKSAISMFLQVLNLIDLLSCTFISIPNL